MHLPEFARQMLECRWPRGEEAEILMKGPQYLRLALLIFLIASFCCSRAIHAQETGKIDKVIESVRLEE